MQILSRMLTLFLVKISQQLRQQLNRFSRISHPSRCTSFPLQSFPPAEGTTALKSLPPKDMNWSPICNVFPPQIFVSGSDAFWKYRWRTETPRDLSPTSTQTSLPPLKQQNGILLATGWWDKVRWDARTASSRHSRVNFVLLGIRPV